MRNPQPNLFDRMHAAVQLLGVDTVDQARGRLYSILGELADPIGLGRFGTPADIVNGRFDGLEAPYRIAFERELDRDAVLTLIHALWGDPLRDDFVNRPDVQKKPLPQPEPDAKCLVCSARMGGMYDGCGFSAGELSSGEVELRLNVGCHVGSTYLSKEMWEAIGKRGGWM